MLIEDAVLYTTIDSLRMFSFASISIAFMCDLYQIREAAFKKLLFYSLLIGGLAFYNVALDQGSELFGLMREESGKKIEEYLDKCTKAELKNDSWFLSSVVVELQLSIFKGFSNMTKALRKISTFIQKFIIILLKVLAPVVFGVAAWGIYRSILQQFVLYTLATAMWSVGYTIADIAILHTLTLFSIPSALNAAGTIIISGGSLLAAMLGFIIVFFLATCIFYILTPFLIFKVLSGSNPAEAINSNMRTAGMTSMAGVGGAYAASKNVLSRNSGGQASSPVNTTSSSSGGSPNRAPMASDRIRARMREMQQKQRQGK